MCLASAEGFSIGNLRFCRIKKQPVDKIWPGPTNGNMNVNRFFRELIRPIAQTSPQNVDAEAQRLDATISDPSGPPPRTPAI